MDSVRSDQLASLAARARACGATILSLDCFDTLVWRTVAHPTDVFNAPPMRMNRYQRMHAEGEARKLRFLRDGRQEVTIHDIYRTVPAASESAVDAAVRAELAAEAEHCFGYGPTIDLVRAAKTRGLQVIIVSDTYLVEPQLRALIARAVGAEVAALIDRVFCSCEHGVSKGAGLFKHVLDALGVAPQSILHVGDNRGADLEAPARLGIHAVHFEQFPDGIEQILRLEASAAALFDPTIRASRPFYQPQRPLLSRAPSGDAGEQLGFTTIGPLMFGFAQWLREQARLAAADGTPVKLLFMMRDGYLPQQAYARLAQAGEARSYAVEISRFTAFAASLHSESDIDNYLAQFIATEKFGAMAAQLLFSAEEARRLEQSARAATDPARAFVKAVKRRRHLTLILQRAARLRERLATYLRKQTDIKCGDRIVLVDLGYAGTVQNRIAPVIESMFDVRVSGRYLLLRDLPGWQDAKRGFIGPDRLDGRAIDTLCDFIALFEQLCTIEQGSVVDYSAAGDPVRKASGLASRQSRVRACVQQGALSYVERAAAESPTGQASIGVHGLRPSCMASLARLLFFPSAAELELFKGFEHDVNMGVDDRVLLFDSDACRDGLRSRGLFYINDNPRQFLPAELRTHGLPLTLALLTQRRFGLDLRRADFGDEPLKLPVMVAGAKRSSLTEIEAHPTHDGYYVALIPIGRAEYSVGIVFGRDFERVQLHDALVTAQAALYRGGDRTLALDVMPTALLEGVRQEVDGVLVLESESAFIYFGAPPLPPNQNYVLSVSFRPLQRRAPTRVQTSSAEMAVN